MDQHLLGNWVIIMISISVLCFIVSEITRNYSQVDKLWSLMPVVYGWLTVADSPSPRLLLMASMVTLWGLRLSYNFYRKGGYHAIPWKGAEDHRWQEVRKHPLLKGRIRFGIFNLLFISFYQNFLIFMFSSPLLLVSRFPEKPLTILDLFAATAVAVFIIAESIADNQQYRFHQEKYQHTKGNLRFSESLKKGFLTEGMWRYSRHPNFLAEQGIWISFYFFGVAASGMWINPTLAGPVLLVLLFQGSTYLTESISSRKYPGYAAYQKSTPKFIPRIRDLIF